MVQRLDERLENPWNAGRWRKGAHPLRRTLGRAAVVFLSTYPQAAARGETAHWLLVVDELQDQDPCHLEAVFEAMRAAHNATSLALGTVKLTTDALWQRKVRLEHVRAGDGVRRLFLVSPEQVTTANPDYAAFLESKVRQYGRHHPIVASEYSLEPMDGSNRLLDERRLALMRGAHPRGQPDPTAGNGGRLLLATLDLAGQDEAATDPLAQLANPGRDYTVAHVWEVVLLESAVGPALPRFLALDVWVDHGSRHFQDHPGRPALVHGLLAWLERWGIAHLIADASGVGHGVTDWLAAALGRPRVTGFDLAGTGKKAALSSALLSLVETGRLRYWTGDQDQPLSDGWWFWRQAQACTYHLPPDGRFERDLQ
jgi:hypothetical protein